MSNTELEAPGNSKTIEMISQRKTRSRKIYTEIIGKNRKTPKTTKERLQMELKKEQDEVFNNIKKLLTEEPCLAHYLTQMTEIIL